MLPHLDPTAPQDSIGSQQYLEATVRTASPARLRLLVIDRSIEVAETLAGLWRQGQSLGSNEHSIRLLDLLNELLRGVTGGGTESEQQLCTKVADLYVFLMQHLVTAEDHSDVDAVEEIRTVLMAEAETWRAVCAGEDGSRNSATLAASGLNFEA